MTFNELIKEFLYSRDIAHQTRETYRRILFLLRDFLVQNNAIINTTTADIILWKSNLTGKSDLTIQSYQKVVKLFFKWACESEHITKDIASGLNKVKVSKAHRKDYIPADQVKILLSNLPGNSLTDLRNAAIVNLMVRTGLRCVEVARLSIKDLEVTGDRASLNVQRKGHREADSKLGITSKSLSMIQTYLDNRDDIGNDLPLFAAHGLHRKSNRLTGFEVGRIVTNALIRAGLKCKTITPHSLRHTAAATAVKMNIDPYSIQKMLGHSSVDTTSIYLECLSDEITLNNPAINSIDGAF